MNSSIQAVLPRWRSVCAGYLRPDCRDRVQGQDPGGLGPTGRLLSLPRQTGDRTNLIVARLTALFVSQLILV